MADWQQHEWKLLIGGELVAGEAGTAPIVNPATEEVVAEAPEASVAQAEEAARFYTSVFKNSRLGEIGRYGEGGPAAAGSVMTVTFTLDGQEFIALVRTRRRRKCQRHGDDKTKQFHRR